MPPDGSRPEEAPSRISREILPGSIREGARVTRPAANTHRLTGRLASQAISYQPGISNGRVPVTHAQPAGSASAQCHNERPGATLTVTTAKLAAVQIGGSRAPLFWFLATACNQPSCLLRRTPPLLAVWSSAGRRRPGRPWRLRLVVRYA